MGQQNIIELNGKRYDAITGAVLGPATTPVTSAAQRRVIDGFIRSSKINQPVPVKAVHPAESARPAASKPNHAASRGKKMDVSRPGAKQLRHHQPQKGQTLMRRAVQKPAVTMKPKVKVQTPSEVAPASVKAIAHPLTKKLSVAKVDKQRLGRAKAIARSGNIRRFQPVRQERTAPAAVQPITRPLHPTAQHHTAQRPVAASASRPQPDIFEAAIARARSHEQPAPRIRSRRARTVNLLAGIGAFLIMGGFLAYLNMPGIEMRFASMKVGFSAQLPSYKPTGYALDNGIKTDGKRISVSFRSGDSSYTVVQQASDWNSQTLLDNYVTLNAASHQTIQSQGRTIYIWDGNKAAWVDGGVRYEITGNAPLTAEDIVKLATSI